ncbi:MAG: hypothetical protein AAFY99_05145 [Pseudomonadota bacterium]
MFSRTNKAMDLARMMIKQAKLLKAAGLTSEARRLAQRAIEMNTMGHSSERALQPIPVRTNR